MKTVYFEETFGANIEDFNSIHEIDEFIEGKIGRKLKIKRYNILPIKDYDIDAEIDKRLK
jgi:hypothetical protein